MAAYDARRGETYTVAERESRVEDRGIEMCVRECGAHGRRLAVKAKA